MLYIFLVAYNNQKLVIKSFENLSIEVKFVS